MNWRCPTIDDQVNEPDHLASMNELREVASVLVRCSMRYARTSPTAAAEGIAAQWQLAKTMAKYWYIEYAVSAIAIVPKRSR